MSSAPIAAWSNGNYAGVTKKKARAEKAALERAKKSTGNCVQLPVLSVNAELVLSAIGSEMAVGIGPAESPIGCIARGLDELLHGFNDFQREVLDELQRGVDELRRGVDELQRGVDELRRGNNPRDAQLQLLLVGRQNNNDNNENEQTD